MSIIAGAAAAPVAGQVAEAAVGKPQGLPIASLPEQVDVGATIKEGAARIGQALQGNIGEAIKLPGS
ncbi:unnamed protein product [Didymodactylos carnosus]|uniref:Uncharacterized protein n=1 Tax=Didymodactylos carnosus TaxID=1234261 RepID=A0A816EV28_9BILA|nr:unnamed protein product [Didymodactylos carnosus]CAF1652984.1 unnamed protein product [Didymodactylos carnosus]CAF3673223.1 unnamed protein product [Didymodactylos carnosus]CAF4585088.1 unnamed protein product [Didymodactylos carnosus]